MKESNVLVLPDIHVPYHDLRTLNPILQVAHDFKWDRIIQIGDFMDFDCISSHNFGKLKTIAGKTLQKDFDSGNAFLDRLEKASPNSEKVILEGNHDERLLRYIDANPQLDGALSVPSGLRLPDRGIEWVPTWSTGKTYNVGNAYFHHGLYTNEFHAKKMVSSFGVNIFYGHTHDVQSFSLVLHGEDKTLVGQSLGCLCLYDQTYLKGAPTKWQQAFGAFHFFGDGFFTYEVVRVFKHRFFFRGKTYQG